MLEVLKRLGHVLGWTGNSVALLIIIGVPLWQFGAGFSGHRWADTATCAFLHTNGNFLAYEAPAGSSEASVFEIEASNGVTYRVEASNEDTAREALAKFVSAQVHMTKDVEPGPWLLYGGSHVPRKAGLFDDLPTKQPKTGAKPPQSAGIGSNFFDQFDDKPSGNSIEVTGPDGAVHVFPGDTPLAVIKTVMSQRYGAQAAPKPANPYADIVAAGPAGSDQSTFVSIRAELSHRERLAAGMRSIDLVQVFASTIIGITVFLTGRAFRYILAGK